MVECSIYFASVGSMLRLRLGIGRALPSLLGSGPFRVHVLRHLACRLRRAFAVARSAFSLRKARLWAFPLLLFLFSGTTTVASPSPRKVNATGEFTSADYAFIRDAIGDRPVVALGESIHVTHEMPLLRLKLLRALHEQHPMDVLAMEGSLIDAWTAQEHAFQSNDPVEVRARRFVREALFGLWQTDEMAEVVAYALSTQSGAHPLYIASFDIQPGSARVYGSSSRKSMTAFLIALRAADPQLEQARIRAWADALGPALQCEENAALDPALRELEKWIDTRAGPVFGRSRPAPHIQALRLVPTMIRSRIQLCREWNGAKRSMAVYQRVRDVMNAKLVLALHQRMPRMFLWAHHSHLHYNSLGRAVPSMGQHLREALGDQLYTIGTFAAGGAAVDSMRADAADGIGIIAALAARPLPVDDRFGVERRLSRLAPDDFFIDLKHAPRDWARPDSSRLEVEGHMATALSRDFDGALLVHEVHGAELNFLPEFMGAAVRATSWVLRHTISALVLFLLLAAGAIVATRVAIRRWHRWRLQHAVAVPS